MTSDKFDNIGEYAPLIVRTNISEAISFSFKIKCPNIATSSISSCGLQSFHLANSKNTFSALSLLPIF